MVGAVGVRTPCTAGGNPGAALSRPHPFFRRALLGCGVRRFVGRLMPQPLLAIPLGAEERGFATGPVEQNPSAFCVNPRDSPVVSPVLQSPAGNWNPPQEFELVNDDRACAGRCVYNLIFEHGRRLMHANRAGIGRSRESAEMSGDYSGKIVRRSVSASLF